MVLKVNRDELYNFTDVMKNDAGTYSTEIEKMESNLERLRNIWQGEDATRFCDNLEIFLKKMKGIPATMETLSKFCDKTNETINGRDEEFGKALEAEALKDDKNE